MDKLDTLKTGDVMLFSSILTFNPISWFDELIKIFTNSRYTHVGVVLRDPVWISEDLKGLYLWESTFEGTPDPQDGKVKFGVQITPMSEIMSRKKCYIWSKAIKTPGGKFTVDNLKATHTEVYDRPYDVYPGDWIESLFRKDPNPQKKDRMFCSALAGFIYTEVGVLDHLTDWSIIRPSDFADEKYLKFSKECSFGELTHIK